MGAAAAIVVETAWTNTHENALNTKAAPGNNPGRLVLLTNDYHTFRDLASSRETAAIGYYRARGWI